MGNPWSLRTIGVYQRFCCTTKRSINILLQPSCDVARAHEDLLRGYQASASDSMIDPIALHLNVLSSVTGNWQAYLEHLHDQLTYLVSKRQLNLEVLD